MTSRLLTLVLAVVVTAPAACTRGQGGVPFGTGDIQIDTAAVPLDPADPSRVALADFLYAGGLALSSRETDLLHGLSDVVVTDTGRLIAVGDMGALVEAQLVLDDAERLVGLIDAHLTRLMGRDGRSLLTKEEADAEGLARLPDGDLLVSFERQHRIWLYPANGAPPRAVPSPAGPFPFNGGLEALADDPEAGDDAYVVGVEETGDTWTCRLTADCVKGPTVEKPEKAGLVAMARLPGEHTAYLLRTYDAVNGNRVRLEIVDRAGLIAHMDLAAPITVDNFEGLAAVPQTDGNIRFYLLSDDNASAAQRTLLLAFDWRPR